MDVLQGGQGEHELHTLEVGAFSGLHQAAACFHLNFLEDWIADDPVQMEDDHTVALFS